MQNVLRALMLATLISLGCGVSGCASGEDEVLEYDPKVSEQRRAEYEDQTRQAMQKQGRPVPQK